MEDLSRDTVLMGAAGEGGTRMKDEQTCMKDVQERQNVASA